MYEATPDCRAFGGSRRNGSCRGKPARLAARQRCDRDRGRRSGSRRPVAACGLPHAEMDVRSGRHSRAGRTGGTTGRRDPAGLQERVATCRPLERRGPRGRSRRRPESAGHDVHGGVGRWRLEVDGRGQHLRAHLAERHDPGNGRARPGLRRHALGRNRRGEPVGRRAHVLWRRRLQVDRRRQDVAALGARAERGDRTHRRRPG